MKMILSHAGVRVQTLEQPDKHGNELAISLPKTSFELSRDHAKALVSLLTVALNPSKRKPIPWDMGEEFVFLRKQKEGGL